MYYMKTFAYEAFGILEVCQLAVVVPSECPDRLAIQVYSCYIYHSDSSVFGCTLGFLLPLARLRCFFLLASTNSKYSLGLILLNEWREYIQFVKYAKHAHQGIEIAYIAFLDPL